MRFRQSHLAWMTKREAPLVIRSCRHLQLTEPPGSERARIAQIMEYAELVESSPEQHGLPLMFVGKLFDH